MYCNYIEFTFNYLSLQICVFTEGQCVKTPPHITSHAILKTKCLSALGEMRWFNKGNHIKRLKAVNLQHSVFTRGALISSFLLFEKCFAPEAQSGLQTLWRFRLIGELTGCLAGNSGSKWCRSIQKSSCQTGQVAGWQSRSRSSMMVSAVIIVRGDCELRPLIRVTVKSAVYHKCNTFTQCKDGKNW